MKKADSESTVSESSESSKLNGFRRNSFKSRNRRDQKDSRSNSCPAAAQVLAAVPNQQPYSEAVATELGVVAPACPQRYLLIWDDAEWNSDKTVAPGTYTMPSRIGFRAPEAAMRRSHRLHGDIDLAPTLKVLPKS